MKNWVRFVLGKGDLLLVLGIGLIGLFFRLKGLTLNYSFWTDEDHVAIFARAILERGKPILENGYSTGSYQWLWYYLTAMSMKLFGIDEFGARFPSLVFGILTIPAIYFVAREFFDKKVALSSAIFTTFLSIEILWSRQARPYQAIQFFYLLEIILFSKFIQAVDERKNFLPFLAGLVLSIIVSSLMHWFGLLPIVFFVSYLILVRFDLVRRILQRGQVLVRKKPLPGVLVVFLGIMATIFILYKLNFFMALRQFVTPAFGKVGFYNHFDYYHSFLWRQYGLITFLFVIGLIIALLRNWRKNSLLIFALIVLFVLVNFRLRVPFTRYFYPMFPLVIILSSVGLATICESLAKALKGRISAGAILLFLTLFIVANGDKFSQRPKSVYSLNADMQEIPEVDFKGLYQRIKEIGGEDRGWVLISTWPDHGTWYLGEGKPDFWLRRTDVVYGNKTDLLSRALILGSVEEVRKAVAVNPQGFILLESWEPFVPPNTVEFIRKNFKKEFEIDRIYPVQPRYWPVEVFSWGFD